jgi:hypothetical protein
MRRVKDILKPAELLNQDDADAVELAYLTRALVQLTLPHSDPGDVPAWVRTNGKFQLVITRTEVDDKGQLITRTA